MVSRQGRPITQLSPEIRQYLENKIRVEARVYTHSLSGTAAETIVYLLSWTGKKTIENIPIKVTVGGKGASPNTMKDIIQARILVDGEEGSYMRIAAMVQDDYAGTDLHMNITDTRHFLRTYSAEAIALLYLKAWDERQVRGEDKVKQFSDPEWWKPNDADRERIARKLEKCWAAQ
ncbi:MAG: hypothetical protein Q9191_003401, partial [Dirinaria sp. TL-2023a]